MSSSWTFRGSERLCEVRVEAASGGAVLSGCSVGNSLVLTCAHSVDGESPALDSAAVRKCANGSTAAWVPAKSIFENTSLDVRVLLLDKPLWDLNPPPWGYLNGDGDIEAELWGYPGATAARSGTGAQYRAGVTITGGSDQPERSIETRLNPRPNTAGGRLDGSAEEVISGWAGISGGPVVADGRLVGILRVVDGTLDALRMVSASSMLLADDDHGRGTLRQVIWSHLRQEVVASNDGLLVPCPVRPVGSTGEMAAVVLEPPVAPLRPSNLRPMAALQYRHAVVPYVPGDPIDVTTHNDVWTDPIETVGRGDTTDARLDGFLETGNRFRAALLTGAGGMGKSRAAQELLVRASADGWVVGLLRAKHESAWSQAGTVVNADLLVVVDYPEDQPTAVRQWMEWAKSCADDASHRVRLLLLSRHRGAFDHVLLESDTLERSDLEALGRKQVGNQKVLGEVAAKRFGQLEMEVSPTWSAQQSTFDTSLAVVAAAFEGGDSDRVVLQRLLERERQFWRSHLVPSSTPLNPVPDALRDEVRGNLRKAVASLSLGGVTTQEQACERLELFGLTAAAAEHLATGYEGMYGDGFEALHPDPVADVLIAELDPDLIRTVLLAAVPDAQADVLVTLARVAGAATNPQTAVVGPFASDLLASLETTWEVFGSALASRAQDGAQPRTTRRALTGLAELIRVLPWDDAKTVQRLERALGCDANILAPLVKGIAAVIDQIEVDHYRAQAAENRAYEPDLAAALNNLAIRLSETGDRAGAVAPAQEAVDLRRAQAAENRAYEPDLAMALNNLAISLSETGDRAGAVAPAQEAVDLRRAQAAENRAYEPNLAAALNNLAISLSETGDRAGAVAPAQEAVDLYQRLIVDESFRSDDLDRAQQTLDGLLDGPE